MYHDAVVTSEHDCVVSQQSAPLIPAGTIDQPTSAPNEPACPPRQSSSAEFSTNPCADIQRSSPSVSRSGYYWIQGGNGAAVNVYCRMNSTSCCGNTGGWMRVGYLDMKNASHSCPSGFTLYSSPRRCGLYIRRETGYRSYKYDAAGCSQITYSTYNTQYRRVCGRITAYQKGTTDAFNNHYIHNSSISSTYVDGVSVTHGSLKHHIWTFAAANDQMRADQWRCPCSRCDQNFTGRVPSFVGNDYFCDSGTLLFPDPKQAYTTNPIWDGSGCAPTSTCCSFNSPPWFCKTLPQPTTDDIELRVCRDWLGVHEDIQVSLIEIYIA